MHSRSISASFKPYESLFGNNEHSYKSLDASFVVCLRIITETEIVLITH